MKTRTGKLSRLAVSRYEELLRQHAMLRADEKCLCGWASEHPFSEHFRHVAESLAADELLDAILRAELV